MIAKLENISLKLNRQPILSGINLELKKGKITTLIGPNGGGKTSIARILLRILKPTSGKVLINSAVKIGYMPQKIEIDKAVQQVQQQAANIPQEIFEKARYEYCKQVVSDYEKR